MLALNCLFPCPNFHTTTAGRIIIIYLFFFFSSLFAVSLCIVYSSSRLGGPASLFMTIIFSTCPSSNWEWESFQGWSWLGQHFCCIFLFNLLRAFSVVPPHLAAVKLEVPGLGWGQALRPTAGTWLSRSTWISLRLEPACSWVQEGAGHYIVTSVIFGAAQSGPFWLAWKVLDTFLMWNPGGTLGFLLCVAN